MSSCPARQKNHVFLVICRCSDACKTALTVGGWSAHLDGVAHESTACGTLVKRHDDSCKAGAYIAPNKVTMNTKGNITCVCIPYAQFNTYCLLLALL